MSGYDGPARRLAADGIASTQGLAKATTVKFADLRAKSAGQYVFSGVSAIIPQATVRNGAVDIIMHGYRQTDSAQMHYAPVDGDGFRFSVYREMRRNLGEVRFVGTGTKIPIWAQGNQNIAYFDTVLGRTVLCDVLVTGDHGIATGGSLSTWPKRLTASEGYNGILPNGQSLSIGAVGQPALSTSQPYSSVTFTGGVKSSTAGDMASFVPLTENNLGEENATGTNRGETICSTAAKYAVERAAVMAGVAPSDFLIFASSPGKGGTAIAGLSKGSAPYARMIAQITAAKAIAAAAGKKIAFHAMPWIQGETDCDNGTSYATYLAALLQLVIDVNADIKAITGQITDVHLLIDQPTYKAASAGGAVQRAQFDAVRLSPLIHFVTPISYFAYAGDNLHLTNVGYQHMGAYFGRAYEQLVVEQRVPDCLFPISAIANPAATVVSLKMRVPTLPLVHDTANYPAATDFGWKIVDDTGTLTITAINIVGDTIQFTLNRALGANPRIRYALDYLGAGMLNTGGASGNLRDSTADTVIVGGVSKPLWHMLLHFELPIIKLVG